MEGYLIESDARRASILRRKTHRHNHNVEILNKKVEVSSENSLDNLLKTTKLPNDFDLLSIDVDGNDYHIWNSLKDFFPKIVVIEINPVLKLFNYVQPIDGVGGASLTNLTNIGKNKGYELISATELNAFFVKREYFDKFNIKDNSPKAIFVDSDSSYGGDRTNYSQI